MSRLTLRRKGIIRAAAISAAGLAGAIVPMSAFGQSLSVNFVIPAQPGYSGTGSTIYATPTEGSAVPVPVTIDVYGTVTGGTLGASDFDGIQYAYYNVNSIGSNENPTVLGGTVTAAAISSASGANFNGGVEAGTGESSETGNGDQVGTLTNATPAGAGQPGVALGSTSAATGIAKPRAANSVWSNASAPAGDIVTTTNSASFLLETITFTAGSGESTRIGGVTTAVQSNLSLSIPTAALAAADLTAANWWADSTSASSSPSAGSFQNGSGTGTYSASAGVVSVTNALPGDANLDGTVGIADFNILAGNYGQPISSSANGHTPGVPYTWAQGDFTGDPTVGIADFNALAGEYGQGAVGAGPLTAGDAAPLIEFAIDHNDVAGFEAATGIAVPEPTTLSLLAVGGLALMGRRRRVSS
jgi:hypothetical protein